MRSLLLLICLLLGSPSYAIIPCASSPKLNNLEGENFLGRKVLHSAKALEKTEISHKGQYGDSVEFVSSKKGIFDLVYELEKINSWESVVSYPDVQGNLLMSIEAWGPALSKKLGFLKIHKDKIQYPSAAEFVYLYNTLKSASKRNQDFFQVDFYPQQTELSSITYLYRFAFYGQIPIATKNRTLLHDLNWHTLSPNLLPPQLVQQLRQKIQILFLYIHEYSKVSFMDKEEVLNTKAELDMIASRLDYILGQAIFLSKHPRSNQLGNNKFDRLLSGNPYSLVQRLDFRDSISQSFLEKYNFPTEHLSFDAKSILKGIKNRHRQLLEIDSI